MKDANVHPALSFAHAQKRPRWDSVIERLMASITARRIRTKVLFDTFVQWLRSGASAALADLWLVGFARIECIPGSKKIQLAMGESVCVSETRKPADRLPAFRPPLLKALGRSGFLALHNVRLKRPLMVLLEGTPRAGKGLKMQRWHLVRRSPSPITVRDWPQ
jgi:hypothetical protein